MKLQPRRRLILLTAAIFLALFLIRPGAARLKNRIASSIGMALQRQVEIGKVHLRLLPQPGFDLDDFVVHDDPAFGAEPILRAQEVTAALRLSALVRGRLEISRLSLNEPSLNLVHREDGRWNIENVLERTAQIAVAPTGKARSEPRPAFPYIESDRGRINFKFGAEKKPFAVTDAKYAIWQESENTWGLRLRGQPVRSDFNLSDMGQLQLTGTWQRAASLRETPFQFSLQWDGAQLGQMTKLFSGEDRGWRGTVRASLNLTGTPANLLVRTDGSLEDFRRYDIAATSPLVLRVHCEAHYDIADRNLTQIDCENPVGDGSLALTGEASNLLGPRRFNLQLVADKIPLQAVLAVVRRTKKDLAPDLQATGTLQGTFSARSVGPSLDGVTYDGSGETIDLALHSETANVDLRVGALPFSLSSSVSEHKTRKAREHRGSASNDLASPLLNLGPVPLKIGRPSPVVLQGWIARTGYNISLKGEAEVQRLLQIARMSGIPASRPAASGTAKIDIQIAGTWAGFPWPQATGYAELRSVQAQLRGVNGPIEIAAAKLSLGETQARLEAISASFGNAQWTGSATFPRGCSAQQNCPIAFNLQADDVSTDQLNEWLSPDLPKRPWYRFASATPQGGTSFFANIVAAGTISAEHFALRSLRADHVSAKLDLDHGRVRVSDIRANVLNGKHRGDWRCDFTAKPPIYSGSGTLEGISLVQLSDLMHDNWIVGTASARYQLELAGYSASEFVDSARGELHVEMRDGTLPRLLIAGAPLRTRKFQGLLQLHKGEVEFLQATLDSLGATYAVTGKATLNRKLDLKLIPEGSPGLTVTGTLSDPKVSSAHKQETQAALKR